MTITETEGASVVAIRSESEPLTPGGKKAFWSEDIVWRLDKDGRPDPHYRVNEAAKCFFGKGADWLRWRSQSDASAGRPHGWFVLNGEPIEPARTMSGWRYYTLLDIEKMAKALAQQGAIDGETWSYIIQTVKLQLRLHGYEF